MTRCTRNIVLLATVAALAMALGAGPATAQAASGPGIEQAADAKKKKKAKKKFRAGYKRVRVRVKRRGSRRAKTVYRCKRKKKPAQQAPGTGGPVGGGPVDVPAGGIADGYYEGATDQGEKVGLSVVGGAVKPERLQLRGTCFDTRDNSTSLRSGHIWSFGEALFPIGSGGQFAGEGTGTGLNDFGASDIRYKLSGQVNGVGAQGTLSMAWEVLGFNTYPYVETWQIFCSGEVPWTAARQ
jgi:hypothetical protein